MASFPLPPSSSQSENRSTPHERICAAIMAIEHFQFDLYRCSSKEDVLTLTVSYLDQALGCELSGVFTSGESHDFDLSTPLEEGKAKRLRAAVNHAVEKGVFGWALHHARPVLVKVPHETQHLLLGTLRTRSKVEGMFAGMIECPPISSWPLLRSITTSILTATAQSIHNDALARELQRHNEELGLMVRQRTRDLEDSAAQLIKSHRIISQAAQITEILLAPEDLTTAVRQSLHLIVTVNQLDVAWLVPSPNADFALQRVTARDPALPNESHEPPIEPVTLLASWEKALASGRRVLVDVSSGKGEEVGWLNEQGVKTLVLLPLYLGRRALGYVRLDSRNGSRIWTLSELNTLATTTHNIAHVLRREHNLREVSLAKEAAELAYRTKDHFLATISHELRTPLNAVLAQAQMLQRREGVSLEETEAVRCIQSSSEHLLRLINDLLDFCKTEAGPIVLRPASTSVRNMVADMVRMVKTRAEQKGLALFATVDPSLPAAIHVDSTRLRQVLLNLLENAIKFTTSGSVTLHAEARQNQVAFTVKDTGPGIPEEDIPRIWEPFGRLEGHSRPSAGPGLGLAVSRKIVEAMGGSIRITSHAAAGTEVWFEFPCHMPAAATPEADAQGPSEWTLMPREWSAEAWPTDDKILKWRELLDSGDVLELQTELKAWAEKEGPSNALAEKLHALAADFQIKAVRRLLALKDT